ncbi:hypothetical protein J8273_3974 [Carpediemonas membranifera]|uniref:Uncharacterized protein n=1 Tax=Carpediemonas membranifera TaxID=201153 RepID=A0A8J6AWN3_9EUKA|nr:hypothetical protein J8273_3974 [Carpediemonas membranifera]|eukprot:KAG9394340.1 hypothetical protein J8273_3974 [Carpediemonas membranifera]
MLALAHAADLHALAELWKRAQTVMELFVDNAVRTLRSALPHWVKFCRQHDIAVNSADPVVLQQFRTSSRRALAESTISGNSNVLERLTSSQALATLGCRSQAQRVQDASHEATRAQIFTWELARLITHLIRYQASLTLEARDAAQILFCLVTGTQIDDE